MKEVVKTLNILPNDTVCLLPMRYMCSELNKEVLRNLHGDEILLLAINTADCPNYLRQKESKKLAKCSDDDTVTAGLENIVVPKIGCKVMLRHVTAGLVNGCIGCFIAEKFSIDQCM